MKKINIGLFLLLIAGVLAGCAGINSNSDSNQSEYRNTQTSGIISDTEMPNDTTDVLSDNSSASTDIGVFDLEKGTVLLNNGQTMPILGIGTYRLSQSEAENSVYWALRDGYRLIDTAHIYGNEEGVGRGIKRAISEGFVTREEIFVTTKMWTSDYDDGENAIEESLRRLDLDYIDLMILHHSQPSNDVTAYQAMEKSVKDGKLRSIGLSNYYTAEDFDRLVNATTIMPAVLQNETHPYYQSKEMNKISSYLFLRTQFVFIDFSQPVVWTLAEYLFVSILFMIIGYGFWQVCTRHSLIRG